ncbi:hypothetical protein CA11_52950 [Gimesia maris]|uniref:hypothetical protein n=1 Tax=Gimesia maris TaxID=122 RepID=UPI00118D406D|nr:hypothetical protein [Gimesia maris]QDU17453.1 hypothetical protein CA11_52950 [Gimesia maris]
MQKSYLHQYKNILILFCLIVFHQLPEARAQRTELLVRALDGNGQETALYEKLVVVSGVATLSATPTSTGEPIEPWAIFFHLKSNDGSAAPVNGKSRVGDSAGNPVGWIDAKHLKTWNTRFILDPIEPQRNRKFVIQLNGGGRAEQNATPEGKRRYALILDPPKEEKGDDTQYPIVVYAGNVQGAGEQGALARQRNELSSVKLEIMFVIESSDFMFIENKDEGKSRLDYIKDSIRGLIADLRQDEGISKAVRLGFAEYKDSVPKASFTSRLTCDLTDDYQQFSRSLDQMSASKLKDDWPDDVISGLNEAVTNASWSENSVKHIVLLGKASCQLNEIGDNPPQSGENNSLEKLVGAKIDKGYNKTGLSITRLIAKGRPQGGSSRVRSAKMFHALHFDKDIFKDGEIENPEETRKQINTINSTVDNFSEAELLQVLGEPELGPVVIVCYQVRIMEYQRKLAFSQYQSIAKNNDEADGLFMAVEPTSKAAQQAIESLSQKIKSTFDLLKKARDGQGMPSQNRNNNEISQPLFTLVGAAAEKFKDQPVIEGTATTRNENGRQISVKKVMVSRQELRRLRSTMDSLHTKFRNKTSKADRQDVGSILTTMKEIIAETSAGQKMNAKTKLKDLITDLPLRTAALDTSAADLALMSTDSFKEWLDRIESAVFRIDDLLNAEQDWLSLSDQAVNDEFTFLRLSELP